MNVVLTLVIVIAATVIILNLGHFAKKSPFSVSGLEYINTQSKYQVLLFGVAGVLLFCLYFVNAANLGSLLALGKITAPAR